MEYIYLINEETTYSEDLHIWATFKAFKSEEKAIEYAKMIKQYNEENPIKGVKREVFIKKVEFE